MIYPNMTLELQKELYLRSYLTFILFLYYFLKLKIINKLLINYKL